MLNPFSRLIKCCFANDLKCRKYFSTRLLLFQDITTLKVLNKILADISLMFSNYFSEKIRLGISCELSARQMIYMKCQALYSSKIYEKNLKKKKKMIKKIKISSATFGISLLGLVYAKIIVTGIVVIISSFSKVYSSGVTSLLQSSCRGANATRKPRLFQVWILPHSLLQMGVSVKNQ